jgi:hypothetical protein
MILDLSPAKPYLEGIKTAESFPALFAYCMGRDDHMLEYELEQAMEVIERECPWLWPAIDRAVLNIVRSESMFDASSVPYDRCR